MYSGFCRGGRDLNLYLHRVEGVTTAQTAVPFCVSAPGLGVAFFQADIGLAQWLIAGGQFAVLRLGRRGVGSGDGSFHWN